MPGATPAGIRTVKPRATAPGRRVRSCPICGAAAERRFRPFCSARCAEIDLGRWLNERYSVPGEPAAGTEESEKSEAD
jgi:endogenous inhibitor of DNA gyrase (YacG/DUF329 family)